MLNCEHKTSRQSLVEKVKKNQTKRKPSDIIREKCKKMQEKMENQRRI